MRFAMTKQRHLIRAGIYQHVFQRSFDRHIIFTSAVDAIFFVSVYYVYSLKYRVETLAFCLMDNHVHFLCKTEKPSDLNAFVRDYSSVFVKGYNAYHKRIGELFQKPFGYAGKVGDKNCGHALFILIIIQSKRVKHQKWNNIFGIFFHSEQAIIHFQNRLSTEKHLRRCVVPSKK